MRLLPIQSGKLQRIAFGHWIIFLTYGVYSVESITLKRMPNSTAPKLTAARGIFDCIHAHMLTVSLGSSQDQAISIANIGIGLIGDRMIHWGKRGRQPSWGRMETEGPEAQTKKLMDGGDALIDGIPRCFWNLLVQYRCWSFMVAKVMQVRWIAVQSPAG